MTVPAVRNDQGEILHLLGLPPNHVHSKALLLLADRYGLDPLLKEIVVIPGKGPFVGVKGAVSVALRSGLLDGMEADDCFETDTHWCVRCIVWRKDMTHPAAKVIGRVGKHEKKDWPLEIARARAVRAALSYAFNIHDDYGESEDQWVPPPEDVELATVISNGHPVDMATGEIIDTAAGPAEEVSQGEPAAAPKRRRTIKPPTTDTSGAGASTGEVHAESERDPGVGQAEASAPAPAPDPPTILVGGHTLAQRLAMAARDAGLDEDQDRHGVIAFVTGGKYSRGSDIPEDDQAASQRCFDAFKGLGDGTLYMRYAPDGTVAGVYKNKKP